MMLNEFLKEHKKVKDLEATVAQQQKGMEILTAQLKEQAAQIQKVSAQLEVKQGCTANRRQQVADSHIRGRRPWTEIDDLGYSNEAATRKGWRLLFHSESVADVKLGPSFS